MHKANRAPLVSAAVGHKWDPTDSNHCIRIRGLCLTCVRSTNVPPKSKRSVSTLHGRSALYRATESAVLVWLLGVKAVFSDALRDFSSIDTVSSGRHVSMSD